MSGLFLNDAKMPKMLLFVILFAGSFSGTIINMAQ